MAKVTKNIKKKKHNENKLSLFLLLNLLVLILFLCLASIKVTKEAMEDLPISNIGGENPNENNSINFHTPSPGSLSGTPEYTSTESSISGQNKDYYRVMDSLFLVPEFKIPIFTADQSGEMVEHDYFTLSYDEVAEQPYWVSYKLTKDMLKGTEKRTNDFRVDPKVSTGSAHPKDYRLSGFDRGHLAPAGDFVYSSKAMSSSFYMSNMSPQSPSFNRGVWKKLEDQVRNWAIEFEALYVVTGPVVKQIEITLGENKVAVPEYFFKVILDIYPPDYKVIAFLLKNEKSTGPLLEYAVTVDSLEKFSGMDFFPMLPDSLELRIENSKDYDNWFE